MPRLADIFISQPSIFHGSDIIRHFIEFSVLHARHTRMPRLMLMPRSPPLLSVADMPITIIALLLIIFRQKVIIFDISRR